MAKSKLNETQQAFQNILKKKGLEAIKQVIEKPKKEDETEVLLKAKLNRQWESAKSSRKELDWKWFIYDLWVNGYHYAKWDKNTQQIITSVKDKGRAKIVINKVYTTLRSVRNYVLRNRPKAEVTPFNLQPDNIDEATKLNTYLDFLHDKLHLRRKMKEVVWHALKYSVGYWQVLWNEDNGGEININVIDPYDLYWDPTAKNREEARYAILAIRRNIDDLESDDKYDKKAVQGLKGDKMLSSSPYKSRMLQAEMGMQLNGKDKEETTIIVREHWLKEKKDGKTLIRIVTMAGDKIIRNEETDLTSLPFFKLASDVEPLSMYGQGWVKNIIPVNKLLNRLESSLAEYNDIMNKGKWVSDKGAGVRVINNEHGQIIEKKRGYDVRQEGINPLSAAIYTQIENANRYIEGIGGAHDAMMGRIPSGAKSGRAIEALQAGDANNLSEIVENLEEFLEEVYECVLYTVATKYQFARRVITTTKAGEKQFLSFIGEEAVNKPQDATVISKENAVDVKITSWLAHTSQARQEILKELYGMKVIDQQTVLEGYEIGAVADVIKRVKAEQEEQMNMQSEMQQQELTNQAGVEMAKEQASRPSPAGVQQAIAAIRAIIQGQSPVVPNNVDQAFIDYIDQFISSQEAQELGEEIISQIQSYRDGLVQSLGQGQM